MTKITVDKALVEQALDAIVLNWRSDEGDAVKPLLRAALAEPKAALSKLANAWDEGYRTGIIDEQMSEANIGIAGFNAKVNPARNNPYQSNTSPKPPDEVPLLTDDEIDAVWPSPEGTNSIRAVARAIEQAVRQKAGLKCLDD